MRRITTRVAAGAFALVSLTACQAVANFTGTATSALGPNRPKASLSLSLRCSDFEDNFAGTGHFTYRDPAAGVAVNGIDVEQIPGFPADSPCGTLGGGPSDGFVWTGRYRTASAPYQTGVYALLLAQNGCGLCSTPFSGTRTVNLSPTSGGEFEIVLLGGGVNGGEYENASLLTGKLTITSTL